MRNIGGGGIFSKWPEKVFKKKANFETYLRHWENVPWEYLRMANKNSPEM